MPGQAAAHSDVEPLPPAALAAAHQSPAAQATQQSDSLPKDPVAAAAPSESAVMTAMSSGHLLDMARRSNWTRGGSISKLSNIN